MKQKGISTGMLKIIAVLCMLMDHIALIFFEIPSPLGGTQIGDLADVPLRAVGRMAFPIFLFCLIEGYFHTHDRKKYAMRLFVFAMISEIPYDFGNFGKIFVPGENNVIWTMFLVVVMCMLLDKAKEYKDTRFALYGITVSLFALAAYFGHVDYGVSAIVAGAALYWLHTKRLQGYLVAIASLTFLFSPLEAFALFSVPLIAHYNNTKGKQVKYFFYVFYPLHLILLRLLYMLIF